MSRAEGDPWDAFPEHDYMAEKHAQWRTLALVCILACVAVAGLVGLTLVAIGTS